VVLVPEELEELVVMDLVGQVVVEELEELEDVVDLVGLVDLDHYHHHPKSDGCHM